MKLHQSITEKNASYIELLKTNVNKGFEKIYNDFFLGFKRFVISKGKNEQDAEDIFQDALLIIYKKIQENNLTLTSSLKGYLYGICKMLMMSNKQRRYSREISGLEFIEPTYEKDMIEEMTQQSKYSLFQNKMDHLPKDQQHVLQLFMEGYSSMQIAQIMGYKSEKYARKKKMISKNKLVALIQATPMYRELCVA